MLLILLACIVATGCRERKVWRIGVSQCSTDDWRSKMNQEIEREAMFHDGEISVEIRSADSRSDRQIEDLRYFADNGFDIILVAPNEAQALTPVVREIYEQGIPVVLFDRDINGDTYTAWQGADNEEIGRLSADMAYALAGSSRVLEIEGLRGSSPAELRRQGFDDRADSLGITVVDRAAADWNYEDALRVTDSLLRLHSDIGLIYAHNDRMAIGAKEAATALGLEDIKVIGIDAAPAIGIQAVADGRIDATFLYPTEGHRLVRTALAILRGEPFERYSMLPTPSAVDASNAGILLLQDKALREETDKIVQLKSRLEDYWRQHNLQTFLLYGVIVILLLLSVVIFLLLRAYWSHKRHSAEMQAKNLQLERQHRELDALYRSQEEATRSKLTFFTNVSHDLRTPLTLIADPVSQLASASNLTPSQHTLMQLADKNVRRLQRLINQILDIRKFDNNRLRLDLMRLDLSKALTEWMAPFEEAARRRRLHLRLEIDPNHDYTTAIDLEKIERVLFNLLSNAFKFTPDGGTITVSLTSSDDAFVLAVKDTGTGIRPEEAAHVFERFFHTDRINPGGSGIGLALSKVFVEMHGGTIRVESEPGRGSRFIVTLPVNHAEAPEADLAPTLAVAASDTAEIAEIESDDLPDLPDGDDRPVVVVIDDNPDVCTLVSTDLTEAGFTVLTARGASQGLRLAARYVPDLVICDVMMPGIDGYEACRRLKADLPTSHIPVLLLTACTADEHRREGYDCGADGYMSKPFDNTMLLSRCRALIANRRLVLQASATAASGPGASTAPKPPVRSGSDIDSDFYRRFADIVERNMERTELSVEDIASEIGLSRVQMYRKIKAITGSSPAELIRDLRLRHARRLLRTTDKTASEVAYLSGFSSPSYFAKCYRERFGETPTDTRSA